MYDRSSSLTDSSQSESSASESDSSSSETMSSDERNTRAHSDSFLSSSGDTSLDDLAQLNNELLIASATTEAAATATHHSANRLLPPKQKKRTPVFSVFEKTNNAGKQASGGKRKNSGAIGSSQLNRHIFYSSDDSVCGIPKPSSKLNSSRSVYLKYT